MPIPTNADFYIGYVYERSMGNWAMRQPEWIGSVASQGFPATTKLYKGWGIPHRVLERTNPGAYKKAVNQFCQRVNNVSKKVPGYKTHQRHTNAAILRPGWPWPWPTSSGSDWAYIYDLPSAEVHVCKGKTYYGTWDKYLEVSQLQILWRNHDAQERTRGEIYIERFKRLYPYPEMKTLGIFHFPDMSSLRKPYDVPEEEDEANRSNR